MQSEGLLPYSQVTATGPYPKPTAHNIPKFCAVTEIPK
jgi:hypothetical protein